MKRVETGKAAAAAILLAVACWAQGAIVRLSVDGESDAPGELNVLAGEMFTIYIVSFSEGDAYWQRVDWGSVGLVGDVWAYPEAGDQAMVSWPPPWEADSWVDVEAADSAGNILAGRHFGLGVNVPAAAEAGDRYYFYLQSPILSDTLTLTVVPEPGTLILLGFGGVLLRRRKKRRK